MNTLNTNSQNLSWHTKCIDDFISSFQKYYPHTIISEKKSEQKSQPDLPFFTDQINSFIKNYNDHLIELWNNTLSEKIKKLKNDNDETLLFGGDKLFLPDSFREEMISSWLLWILEASILEDEMREKVLNAVFSKITQSETYLQYPEAEKTFNFSFKGVHFRRELSIKTGRLDIFIEAHDFIITIENKIGGDKNFKKNISYRDELDLDKKFANKKRYYFLLVPGNDLNEYLEEESEEESNEKKEPDETPAPEQTEKQKVLSAFPPITWEEFLMILRLAIQEYDNDNTRWKHWKTLALSFISCVEGNVLGFDLKEISKSVNAQQSHLPLHLIRQINEYLQYRKL